MQLFCRKFMERSLVAGHCLYVSPAGRVFQAFQGRQIWHSRLHMFRVRFDGLVRRAIISPQNWYMQMIDMQFFFIHFYMSPKACPKTLDTLVLNPLIDKHMRRGGDSRCGFENYFWTRIGTEKKQKKTSENFRHFLTVLEENVDVVCKSRKNPEVWRKCLDFSA